jgi:hypothetical protein
MTGPEWLLGAVAGALAGAGTAELRERFRLRRAVDGAALDLARDTLEDVRKVSDEFERTQLGSPVNDDYLAGQVTAELRDRIGRAAGHVHTRVADPVLDAAMSGTYAEFRQARGFLHDRSGMRSEVEPGTVGDFLILTGLMKPHVAAARASAEQALERIATLERERPRR